MGSSSTSLGISVKHNPRVVRVSPAFGGKDRHSKVYTVRGVRDRRVRLSISTAIQLYDLQDQLGLNQPSKVVDWLLNAAKHRIDQLPPLQFPPGFFHFQNRLQLSNTSSLKSSKHEPGELSSTNNHDDGVFLQNPTNYQNFGVNNQSLTLICPPPQTLGSMNDQPDRDLISLNQQLPMSRNYDLESSGDQILNMGYFTNSEAANTLPVFPFTMPTPSNLSSPIV